MRKCGGQSALVAMRLEQDLEAELEKRGDMTATQMQQWVASRTLPAVLSKGAAAVLQRFVIPEEHRNSPAPGGLLGRLQAALNKPTPIRTR